MVRKNRPAHPLITMEVMAEFERLRKTGMVNMNDMDAVYTAAGRLNLVHLFSLLEEDQQKRTTERAYLDIIRRREFYLDKFKMRK